MANIPVPTPIPFETFCSNLLVMLSSCDRSVRAMYSSKEEEVSLFHFEMFVRERQRMTKYLKTHSPAYDGDPSVQRVRDNHSDGYRVGVLGTDSVRTEVAQ